MKSGVIVRKAQAEDLDAVKALADANRASLGFVLRPALADGIEAGWLLVAERGGRVIGFVHYRHRKDARTTIYQSGSTNGINLITRRAMKFPGWEENKWRWARN